MRTKFTRCRYNKQADESEGSKLGNYNKIFPEPLCDFVQQRLTLSLTRRHCRRRDSFHPNVHCFENNFINIIESSLMCILRSHKISAGVELFIVYIINKHCYSSNILENLAESTLEMARLRLRNLLKKISKIIPRKLKSLLPFV